MISCRYEATDQIWVTIQSQVARLERLDKFPFGAEGKRELCFALLTANSLQEAIAIIDRIMASEATYECPSGPDIRRMINAEHTRGESTADELAAAYRRTDTTLPPTQKQRLERHMLLVQARQKELDGNSRLYRVGPDNKLVQTELRDKLAAMTEELRAGY